VTDTVIGWLRTSWKNVKTRALALVFYTNRRISFLTLLKKSTNIEILKCHAVAFLVPNIYFNNKIK
jgi:hypothetical protein